MRAMIYGALAKPHPLPSDEANRQRRIKRQFFELRDRLMLLMGSTALLDYRNYESGFSSNVGDRAIAETISDLIRRKEPSIEIDYRNWGTLDAATLPTADGNEWPIIVAGGGYFLLNLDGELPNRIEDDLKYFEAIRTPLILFGVGLNQPAKGYSDIGTQSHWSKDCNTLVKLLERADLISVRDEATLSYLRPFTDKSIALIGDPALFLTGMEQIANGSAHEADRQPPTVGINFSFHGPTSNAVLRKNIFEYANLLKALHSKTKCKFRYIVHYDTEHLIPRLLAMQGLDIEVAYGPPKELLSAYSSLDLHLGGMLHSCIMAHSVGVPCISLAYDIKHFGFFKLMGLDENYCSALDFQPEAILAKAIALLKNPQPTRQMIAARKRLLGETVDTFVDNCISLLKG